MNHDGKRLQVAILSGLLLLLGGVARAQGPGADYIDIYHSIQDAERLRERGEPTSAAAQFREAYRRLQEFRSANPNWNPEVVEFRLDFIRKRLIALKKAVEEEAAVAEKSEPSRPEEEQRESRVERPAAGDPTGDPTDRVEPLKKRVQQLQREKEELEARLKEALKAQPTPVEAHELDEAKQRVQSLEKENEALKNRLEEARAAEAEAETAGEEGHPADEVQLNYSKELEQARKAVRQSEEEIRALKRRLKKQTEQRRQLETELKETRQEKLALEKKQEQLRQEVRSLRDRLDNSKAEQRPQPEVRDTPGSEGEERPEGAPHSETTSSPKPSRQDRARKQLRKIMEELESHPVSGSGRLEDVRARQANPAGGQPGAGKNSNPNPEEGTNPNGSSGPGDPQAAGSAKEGGSGFWANLLHNVVSWPNRLYNVVSGSSNTANPKEGGSNSNRSSGSGDQQPAGSPNQGESDSNSSSGAGGEQAAGSAKEGGQADKGSPRSGTIQSLPPGAGPLVSEAQRAFARRDYAEAEEKYQQVLELDEKNVFVLANLASIQIERDRLDQAEKNLELALEQSPRDGYSLFLRGIIEFRRDNYEQALELLQQAAQENPENAQCQNYLGIVLSEAGRPEAAEAALRKAIRLEPRQPNAHYNLARLYLAQEPTYPALAQYHYRRARDAGHAPNRELERMLEEGLSQESADLPEPTTPGSPASPDD